MNSKMKLPGEWVVIDLSPVNRLDQLFDALGKAFDLGGPGGNLPVQHDVDGKGWGQNWNALADSLMCLDSGGIWSTSRRFKFPLYVDFQNASLFRIADLRGTQHSARCSPKRVNAMLSTVWSSDSLQTESPHYGFGLSSMKADIASDGRKSGLENTNGKHALQPIASLRIGSSKLIDACAKRNSDDR